MHSKLLLLIIAALLSGCGHKGPLYLPGQKPPSGKQGTTQSAPPANAVPTDATPTYVPPTHAPITQP